MPQPFFIIGVGRSGTTLLRLMLHAHPDIAIPYESHFISGYQRRIAEYGDLGDERHLRRLVDDVLDEEVLELWDHEYDADRLLAALRSPTLRGVVEAMYEEYAAAHGKSRWGDKSDYLDELPYLYQLFPDARFVHMIRDGRDVARSVLGMSWGPTDLIGAANWWSDHVWLARRLGAMLGDQYIEVRFEDLLVDTEGELRRLCDFLDEPYDPRMLRFYEHAERAIPEARRGQHYNTNAPPKASRASSWRQEMPAVDVAIFDRYAGRMLDECGYERPAVRVGKVRLGLRMLRIMGRKWRTSGL